MKNTCQKILIIDDEENMLHMLTAYLARQGYKVANALNGAAALEILATESFDIILCDLKMPVMDGIKFLEATKERGIISNIIMMSAFATVDTAVEAMKLGAYDFISKPFKVDEILCVLQKIEEFEELKTENEKLRQQVDDLQGRKEFDQVIGESTAIKKVIELAGRVAKYNTPVLISGESGTGKELFAKGIHSASPRSRERFVAVNCGSIPENLMESEFFGYVKGAFTGADKDKDGLFTEASGGTLFLDEIAELPLPLQVKLLRVLQEQEVRPVGSNISQKIDVRIIAATAKSLIEEIDKQNFRQDLFYRLNVVEVALPPLRDREGDLRILVNHFLSKFKVKISTEIHGIDSEALAVMDEYSWPGNIRELENAIEYAMIYSENGFITVKSLPAYIEPQESLFSKSVQQMSSIKEGRALMEKHLIQKALSRTEGNKTHAAEILEISYPSLLSKIKEYGIIDF